MSNEIPDFLNQPLFGNKGYLFSESDIISSYIDGKISKEEYIRRMNEHKKTINSHEFDDLEAKLEGIEDLHQIGKKDDSAKPRLDLVLGDFANALWEVGKVGTFGANKYTDRGWHEVPNAEERYLSAMLRHYLNYKLGEELDKESNLPHLAHMAWNALAVLQLHMENK